MHELARHTIHSSEMVAMAIENVGAIIQEHDIFIEESQAL
jgi:hypothetical protein